MDTIMEWITNYNNKLKEGRKRSISRICNSTILAFLFFMTTYVAYADGSLSSFTITLGFLGILFVIRILHVYFMIADTLPLKALYFGMVFFLVSITGLAFFYIPILFFLLIIITMLISFPFIFAKLEKLETNNR